jgi:hypothetical protein
MAQSVTCLVGRRECSLLFGFYSGRTACSLRDLVSKE